MDDRISRFPGRAKITPEDGSPAFYATIEMADEPEKPGTPLNTKSLFSHQTETSIFGDLMNRTPSDAFNKLHQLTALAYANFPMVQLVAQKGNGGNTPEKPAVLSFSFVPDIILGVGILRDDGKFTPFFADSNWTLPTDAVTTTYKRGIGFCSADAVNRCHCKKSDDGKTISWYAESTISPAFFNDTKTKYYFLGIRADKAKRG